MMQTSWIMTETLAHGYLLWVFSESYPMNTNRTGLDVFQKSLHPCALDEICLSIGRVKSIREADNKVRGILENECDNFHIYPFFGGGGVAFFKGGRGRLSASFVMVQALDIWNGGIHCILSPNHSGTCIPSLLYACTTRVKWPEAPVENNFVIKHKFAKYLKENCRYSSNL